MTTTVHKYAIFKADKGLAENVPAILLDEAWTSDNENVQMRFGEIRSASMRNAILDRTPSPNNPILTYLLLEELGGNYYLFAFTKDMAYQWDSAGSEWDEWLATDTAWSGVTAYVIGDICIFLIIL